MDDDLNKLVAVATAVVALHGITSRGWKAAHSVLTVAGLALMLL